VVVYAEDEDLPPEVVPERNVTVEQKLAAIDDYDVTFRA
jgi:hypothetical protein